MLRRAAITFGVPAVAAAVVAVAVNGIGSGAVGNGSGRIGSTSSNFPVHLVERGVARLHEPRALGTGADPSTS